MPVRFRYGTAGDDRIVGDALKDPHIAARGLIVETDHPHYGTVKTLASPVRVGDTFAPPTRAPRRGEHTRDILTELTGMDDHALAEAEEAGAFGPAAVPAVGVPS